jgi:hypothetical protein
MKLITATTAREMANNARSEDLTLEKVVDKIINTAKLGEYMTTVLIPKEHVGYVTKKMRSYDFEVRVYEDRVYHSSIMISWDLKT